MAKIAFKKNRMRQAALEMVEHANGIIEEYQSQGFKLTLRQLYYQFVTANYFSNNLKNYKRLVEVMSLARLCGLVDWSAIEDRLRKLEEKAHWPDAYSIVEACAHQFQMDRWRNQQNRVEVWIEKDALTGVIADVCDEFDVPYFACRGSVSQSAMYEAANRLRRAADRGQRPIILHLGDHDPSGIDMTRDNQDRLNMMIGVGTAEVRRIALNMDQVNELNLVPNPAKQSDSNWAKYVARFGVEHSWELDALSPPWLVQLVRTHIEDLRDAEMWAMDLETEEEERQKLVHAMNGMRDDATEDDDFE